MAKNSCRLPKDAASRYVIQATLCRSITNAMSSSQLIAPQQPSPFGCDRSAALCHRFRYASSRNMGWRSMYNKNHDVSPSNAITGFGPAAFILEFSLICLGWQRRVLVNWYDQFLIGPVGSGDVMAWGDREPKNNQPNPARPFQHHSLPLARLPHPALSLAIKIQPRSRKRSVSASFTAYNA